MSRPWQKVQASSRRAPMKRVAVTIAFTSEELAAIGHEMIVEEPSPPQIRRFMQRAIEKRLEDATRRYEEREIKSEQDIHF